MTVARIALAAATFAIDRPYSYRVPEDLAVVPGMRVLVPFGKGNRPSEGLVLSLGEGETTGKLKKITALLDHQPVLTPEGVKLALWMRERFFCTVYAAALTMLPTGLWYVLKEGYALAPGADWETWQAQTEGQPRAVQILQFLQAAGGRGTLEQIQALPGMKDPRGVLRQLEKAGLVVRETTARRKVKDKTEKIAVLAVPPAEALARMEPKRKVSPTGWEVTSLLCSLGSASVKELCYFTGASRQTVNNLEKRGILSFQEREVFRRPLPEADQQPLAQLSGQQQAAYEGLAELMDRGTAQAALLYGVTGSGKTQVYLHLIQKTLAAGRGAIVMVPEIALTPSLLQIFTTHFGRQVAVLHSCLPSGERYDEWKRVRDGQAKVVVGTRSAVFAPLTDIGLIILDEEQESSYQSESMVRYHARDVAKFRCTQHKGLLLLGSATPAVESRYAAEQGQYHLFTLTQRYNARHLPQVMIADMKEELRQGNGSGLSRRLGEEIEENLRRGEQSILFLNRRGNSRMVVCPQCGQVPTCPRCSVHLTYHSANGRLMCHYCGYSQPLPDLCPDCHSRLEFVGMGTQKLQEELQQRYPDVEILRMDADTISAAHSHEVLLDRFRRKNIPILLGTQMVAKGLDFPNVTLVGVVDGDLSLYTDNYRAAERTFSLLTQVVGRAGRGDKPGRAVIQTWTPDNDVITLAARQDYDTFYRQERQMRQMLRFPPFLDLFRLTVSGLDETQVLRACALVRRSLEPWVKPRQRGLQGPELLGPAPAPILKVNNRYRYRLLLKCRNDKEIRALLAQILRAAQEDRANRGLSLLVDVNPMD